MSTLTIIASPLERSNFKCAINAPGAARFHQGNSYGPKKD
jgi:hypothetical protein